MLAVYVICFHTVYLFDDTDDMNALLEVVQKEIGTSSDNFPATDQLEILLDAAEPHDANCGYDCNRMYIVNLEW